MVIMKNMAWFLVISAIMALMISSTFSSDDGENIHDSFLSMKKLIKFNRIQAVLYHSIKV
jgi:hypothetical protein